MKKVKTLIASLGILFLGSFAVLAPAGIASAYDPLDGVCNSGVGASEICDNRHDEKAETTVKDVVNLLLFVVGALAVVMIIFSGISYTLSQGDAGRVAKAKNTLIYSVVGLIVAFLAFAIVNWVIGEFN